MIEILSSVGLELVALVLTVAYGLMVIKNAAREQSDTAWRTGSTPITFNKPLLLPARR